MNKSVIVYGPQGCGKTRYAERIAKHFGLDEIRYGVTTDEVRNVPLHGVLALMTLDGPAGSGVYRVLSFAEVAQQINAAIPVTDWQCHKPQHVGEYETRHFNNGVLVRRWFNGKRWSYPFFKSAHQEAQNTKAGQPTYIDNREIQWRGLAEEPIIIPA